MMLRTAVLNPVIYKQSSKNACTSDVEYSSSAQDTGHMNLVVKCSLNVLHAVAGWPALLTQSSHIISAAQVIASIHRGKLSC